MERQVLVSLLVFGIAASALGAGTFAFFSDTAQSSSNLFTATTLNLLVNNVDAVTGTIGSTAFSPGDEVTGSLTLKNAGTIANSEVDLDFAFDFVATDAAGATSDMAKFLQVTELSYGTANLLTGCLTDGNANGFIDLADLDGQTCVDQGSPGTGTALSMKVKFHTTAGNDLQGDSVTLTMRYLLAQTGASDIAAA
jgi:predicted ribosomally synthesized peptide with SipW-like signal peptide